MPARWHARWQMAMKPLTGTCVVICLVNVVFIRAAIRNTISGGLSKIFAANQKRKFKLERRVSVEKPRAKFGKRLWSLLWRATLFAPVAIVLLAVFLAAWLGLFLLPVGMIYFLWQQEWFIALLLLAGWSLLFLLTRWKRFRIDSKDILNEQENI